MSAARADCFTSRSGSSGDFGRGDVEVGGGGGAACCGGDAKGAVFWPVGSAEALPAADRPTIDLLGPEAPAPAPGSVPSSFATLASRRLAASDREFANTFRSAADARFRRLICSCGE